MFKIEYKQNCSSVFSGPELKTKEDVKEWLEDKFRRNDKFYMIEVYMHELEEYDYCDCGDFYIQTFNNES